MVLTASIPPLDTNTLSDQNFDENQSPIDDLNFQGLDVASTTVQDEMDGGSSLGDFPEIAGPVPMDPRMTELYGYRFQGDDPLYLVLEDRICGHAGFLHSQESLEGVAVQFDDSRNGDFVKNGREYNMLVFGEAGNRQEGQRIDAVGTFCEGGKTCVCWRSQFF